MVAVAITATALCLDAHARWLKTGVNRDWHTVPAAQLMGPLNERCLQAGL